MVDAASVFAGAAAGALLTLVLFVLLPWFLLEDLLSGKKELLRAQFVHNALIVRKGVMRFLP